VARLRIFTVVALSIAFACASLGGATALAAHRAHHALRCGKGTRLRKRTKHRRASCVKIHRAARKRHAVSPKPSSSAPQSNARSKSADYSSEGCADALLKPSEQNLESIRTATLCLVNHERMIHGEPALRANQRLQQAAQGHTESMVQGDYFEHLGPGGETPLQRMRASGYIYSSQIGYAVGENIAWGTLYLGTPRAIVAAWMASPGHRANILDSQYRDTGIGVSPHPPRSLGHGQSGGIYTQDFGVIVGG
jgi:uncharacterized protein YkwD